MKTYQSISLSLPPKLVKQIGTVAKREGKTKSEFIREALRQHLELKELRRAQAVFSKRANNLGIRDEADIERIVEADRSEQARSKR